MSTRRWPGHAGDIRVTLFRDGSLEVVDDGRGMPVDKHPKLKKPGVEVILTTLHAGGKFSNDNYRFSGGLHGVGVSVVNALSKKLEVSIRRGGKEYLATFKGGNVADPLAAIGGVGQRNTGTRIRFWPDPRYFDSAKISLPKLRHLLRAKAVLCPKLRVRLHDEASGEKDDWYFEDGLVDYLSAAVSGAERLPGAPLSASMAASSEAADWAVLWLPEGGEAVQESYVNLVPTAQGGTHVNGLRTGLTEAVREFCDFRNLLPRGVKIAPEDVWERVAYVLSVKMEDPQFSGQTKERLSSRECAAFVSGVVKDHTAQWLNRHPETATRSPLSPSRAPRRAAAPGARWSGRRSRAGRRCRASSPTAPPPISPARSSSWSRGTPRGARPSRRATGSSRRSCRSGARS